MSKGYAIEDGMNLPFVITEGETHDELRGEFRPMNKEELASYRAKMLRYIQQQQTANCEALLFSELAKRLTSWVGPPFDPSTANLRKLKPELLDKLEQLMTGSRATGVDGEEGDKTVGDILEGVAGN